jgi:hypothetical protein
MSFGPPATEIEATIEAIRLAQREHDASIKHLEVIIEEHNNATDRVNKASEALNIARENMYEAVVKEPWTADRSSALSGTPSPVRVVPAWNTDQ